MLVVTLLWASTLNTLTTIMVFLRLLLATLLHALLTG
jgi:hypothetical protein